MDTMYCTQCGAKLEDGSIFCTRCGAPVEGAEPQPERPVEEPEASAPEQPAGAEPQPDGSAQEPEASAPEQPAGAEPQPERPAQEPEASAPEQPAGAEPQPERPAQEPEASAPEQPAGAEPQPDGSAQEPEASAPEQPAGAEPQPERPVEEPEASAPEQPADVTDTMYCTQCGAKLEDGSAFCTNCGAPARGAEPQPERPMEEPEASVPEQPAGVTDTMYCTQCGAKLEDGSAFCTNCGAPARRAVPQPESPVQRWEASRPEQSAGMQQYPLNGTPMPAAAPVNSYYAAEFEKLRVGQKSKFNWAAFFLGPYNQLYHGSTALFKKTFLPYLIVDMIWFPAVMILSSVAMVKFDLTTLLLVSAAEGVMNLLLFVWGLVLAILNGANYNRRLFEQTNGDAAAVKKIKKNVWLLAGVLLGWGIVMALIAGGISAAVAEHTWTSGFGGVRDDVPYSYSEPYDSRDDHDEDRDDGHKDDEPDSVPAALPESVPAADSSVPAPAEPAIDLSEFSDLEPAYTELFLRAMPVYSSGVASGFDNYCLYGDEAVTVGELFDAALGEYEWINTWDGGQTDSYSVFFELDDLEYELRFSAPYGDAFSNATIQGFYSASGRMLQDSDYNTANLLARLCQYYHTYVQNTTAYSRVFGIYGDWRSEDGSVVLAIGPNSYAGNDYRIDRVDNVGVYVDITRNNGNIDHRILVPSEDHSILYIYNNNNTTGPAELMGAYYNVG